MNRTKIEWCDYTWNPITGCTYGCAYCYARRITERFPDKYPQGFAPTFWGERVLEPVFQKKPARIFTCSMGDFWDPAIPDRQRAPILDVILKCQRHRFLILTKRPEKIHPPRALWCLPNLWIGVTVDLPKTEWRIDSLLQSRQNMGITGWHPFVSFEPLVGEINLEACGLDGIDWVIIGAQTNPIIKPNPEWIQHIVGTADNSGVPVFMKNNLGLPQPRQEFPEDLDVNQPGWGGNTPKE
jgi:protein gp37